MQYEKSTIALIAHNYYFISVFSKLDKDYGIANNLRVWGFFDNKEEAEDTLINNKTDLWEYTYDYGIIEEYNTGISGYTGWRWFYHYNRDTNHYESIEEPEEVKHWSGFALG